MVPLVCILAIVLSLLKLSHIVSQNLRNNIILFIIAIDTNVSFKELCCRVAAITGLWYCVVCRGICLLKAHLCSSSFLSNCVGDAAPKQFGGCGFVLTIKRHTFARGLICAMRIPSNLAS